MSDGFRSFNWIRGVADDAEMSVAYRLVLIRLVTHRYQNGQCNPTYRALADELGVHRYTAIRAVAVGIERGWLSKSTSRGRFANNFEFTFPQQSHPSDRSHPPQRSLPSDPNGHSPVAQRSQRQRASRAKSNTSRRNGQYNGQGERAHSVRPPPNMDLKKKPKRSKERAVGAFKPEDMDRFWSVYPKRIKRPDAEKEFAAALKRGATAEQIIDGAKRYANDAERLARAQEVGSERFTEHPVNWLRRNGWEDAYSNGGRTLDQHGNEVVIAKAPAFDDIPDGMTWDELWRGA
jgi:hypothetical protein